MFTEGLNPNDKDVVNAKKTIYALFIAVLLFFAACSTQNYYRTLSFFFDGVPDLVDVKEAVVMDSLQTAASDTKDQLSQVSKSALYLHRPYLEKECASCHNQGRMGSLSEPQPALCYQCHDNFGEQYTSEHGPMAAGYCSECHNPHRAKQKNLLVRTRQDLCFGCHETSVISESVFHNIVEESDCIACHDPHGSNNHSLLQNGSCYQCHDRFSEKYTVVHGPVTIGRCSVCHRSHGESSEKLLKHLSQNLCLYCHDAGRLFGNETHSYIEDTQCTECHNPHGGEDRFMFY